MKRNSILAVLILAVMLVLAHLLARHGVNSWTFYPDIIYGWVVGLVVGYLGLFGGTKPTFLSRLFGVNKMNSINKQLLGFLSYELVLKVLSLVLLTAYWSRTIMQQPHDWDVKLGTASWLLVAFYSSLVLDTKSYLDHLHGRTDKENDVR